MAEPVNRPTEEVVDLFFQGFIDVGSYCNAVISAFGFFPVLRRSSPHAVERAGLSAFMRSVAAAAPPFPLIGSNISF